MTARLPRGARRRTCWGKVIDDLLALGYTQVKIGSEACVTWQSLRNWRIGHQPTFEAGLRLLLVWSVATGKEIKDRPIGID